MGAHWVRASVPQHLVTSETSAQPCSSCCQVLAFCALAVEVQLRTPGETLCRFPAPSLLCVTLQSPPHIQLHSLLPREKHKASPPLGVRLLSTSRCPVRPPCRHVPSVPGALGELPLPGVRTTLCLSICLWSPLFPCVFLGTGDKVGTGWTRFPPPWSRKPLVYGVWGGADNKERKEQRDVD